MSVGWDVKWCPVSRITTPLARLRPFHWISMKSRFVKAAMETSNFTNDHRSLIVTAVIWPKYCWYGVKHYTINQSSLSKTSFRIFEIYFMRCPHYICMNSVMAVQHSIKDIVLDMSLNRFLNSDSRRWYETFLKQVTLKGPKMQPVLLFLNRAELAVVRGQFTIRNSENLFQFAMKNYKIPNEYKMF